MSVAAEPAVVQHPVEDVSQSQLAPSSAGHPSPHPFDVPPEKLNPQVRAEPEPSLPSHPEALSFREPHQESPAQLPENLSASVKGEGKVLDHKITAVEAPPDEISNEALFASLRGVPSELMGNPLSLERELHSYRKLEQEYLAHLESKRSASAKGKGKARDHTIPSVEDVPDEVLNEAFPAGQLMADSLSRSSRLERELYSYQKLEQEYLARLESKRSTSAKGKGKARDIPSFEDEVPNEAFPASIRDIPPELMCDSLSLSNRLERELLSYQKLEQELVARLESKHSASAKGKGKAREDNIPSVENMMNMPDDALGGSSPGLGDFPPSLIGEPSLLSRQLEEEVFYYRALEQELLARLNKQPSTSAKGRVRGYATPLAGDITNMPDEAMNDAFPDLKYNPSGLHGWPSGLSSSLDRELFSSRELDHELMAYLCNDPSTSSKVIHDQLRYEYRPSKAFPGMRYTTDAIGTLAVAGPSSQPMRSRCDPLSHHRLDRLAKLGGKPSTPLKGYKPLSVEDFVVLPPDAHNEAILRDSRRMSKHWNVLAAKRVLKKAKKHGGDVKAATSAYELHLAEYRAFDKDFEAWKTDVIEGRFVPPPGYDGYDMEKLDARLDRLEDELDMAVRLQLKKQRAEGGPSGDDTVMADP